MEWSRRLKERIARLARRSGTPAFEPHVTLLGGLMLDPIEFRTRCRELVPQMRALEVRLIDVVAEDDFFRSIVYRIEATPGLLSAHSLAEFRFGRTDAAPFSPHLSMVYGSLPREKKTPLLLELSRDLPIVFRVASVDAVRTDGEVAAWRRLERFPLEP